MPDFANISGFKTVVYVEDQEVNILLMQAMLRHRPGLRLVVASSGTQAWELTEGLEPALLMLDIRLPDCTGIELLLRLRQHPGCRDAPAVAVTAEHDFSIRNTGFVELWTKPLHFDRVLSQLDALVGGQGLIAEPFSPSNANGIGQTQLKLIAGGDALTHCGHVTCRTEVAVLAASRIPG